MNVYFLYHAREVEPNVTDTKHIGIYSSMSAVDITINKYKNITGFKDYPDNFVVEEYEVIGSESKELLSGNTIYFLQHEHSVDEDGIIYDYITNIDMFADYHDAKKEMEQLIKGETYPKSPNGVYPPYGFCLDKCIIDEDNWIEGFVSS